MLVGRGGTQGLTQVSTACKEQCMLLAAAVTVTRKGAANHSSKVSEELKTRGSTKLRRDQSSPRLFWMGVPVSSTRCLNL